MALWDIYLDRHSRLPLYLQIKTQIKELILKGELSEGKRLLPSRELARVLGVNRTTVVSAYNELLAEGLIDSRVGRGTMVSEKQVQMETDNQPMNWSELFSFTLPATYYSLYREMSSLFFQKDTISFGLAMPDPSYFPVGDFERIVKKVLREKGSQVFLLSPIEGIYPLREILAEGMTREGRPTSPEEVIITSGSTQGLYLLANVLLKPGDLVVLENPTSIHALRIFRAADARMIDIPIDEAGMNVDILGNLLSRQRVKLIYTVPTYQNPSGAVLSLNRRKKLLNLAHQFHIPIIEEDPYSRLCYGPPPPPALRVLDIRDQVIFLGTFSKILFSGLRVGWLIASKQVIKQLAPVRHLMDLHSNTMEQHLFYEYCRQGLLDKHIQKVRRIYARKRDLLVSSLEKYCSSLLTWHVPDGGCHLWCRLEGGLNAVELLHESIFEKVAFIEGKVFSAKENCDEWFRLNFTYLDESLIQEGVKRLGRALLRMSQRYGIKGNREKSSHRPLV